jgi:hypothetical protein
MVITHFGLHQAPGAKIDSSTMAVSRKNGCFSPEKDVVAPGNKGLLGPAANRTFGEQGRQAYDAPKEVTLMFVGGCPARLPGCSPFAPAALVRWSVAAALAALVL